MKRKLRSVRELIPNQPTPEHKSSSLFALSQFTLNKQMTSCAHVRQLHGDYTIKIPDITKDRNEIRIMLTALDHRTRDQILRFQHLIELTRWPICVTEITPPPPRLRPTSGPIRDLG